MFPFRTVTACGLQVDEQVEQQGAAQNKRECSGVTQSQSFHCTFLVYRFSQSVAPHVDSLQCFVVFPEPGFEHADAALGFARYPVAGDHGRDQRANENDQQ